MDPYKFRPSSAFNSPMWRTHSGAPVWNNDNSLTVGAREFFNKLTELKSSGQSNSSDNSCQNLYYQKQLDHQSLCKKEYYDGPILLEDYHLVEKLANLNRERIPEHVVHARGGSA